MVYVGNVMQVWRCIDETYVNDFYVNRKWESNSQDVLLFSLFEVRSMNAKSKTRGDNFGNFIS